MAIVEDVPADSAHTGTAGSVKARGSRRPKVRVDEEREVARLYADTSTPTSVIRARFSIGESSLYRIVERQGVPLRGRTVTSSASDPLSTSANTEEGTSKTSAAAHQRELIPQLAAATIGNGAGGTKAARKRGRSARRPRATERRTPLKGSSTSVSGVKATQFRIKYYAERVFEAPTIQDALRQAESLGAIEILGAVRQAP